MASSQTWQISLFGPLRVSCAEEEVRVPAGKVSSLLAYLLLHPNRVHQREHLIDLLWQEMSPERGRRALTYTLYRLRETKADALVSASADEVVLNLRESLSVDLWRFEELTHAADVDSLDSAIALVTAPLLPEIYDDWIVPRRILLQSQHLDLLLRRAALAEETGDFSRAAALYMQATQHENLDESGWRGLMRNQAHMGQIHEALETYRRLELLLDEEMGVSPEAESAALAEQLRSEIDFRRTTAESSLFVGRTPERARLIANLEAAIKGAGGLSVLVAESGMGRTTLMREVERSAQWRGVQVVWAVGSESPLPEVYAPLSQALRSGLPTARLRQLQHFVRQPWLDLLQEVLAPSAEKGRWSADANHASRLGMAVAHVLRALGDVVPHLFLLDDLQWADPSVWPLLDAMLPLLRDSRILFVLSTTRDYTAREGIVGEYLARWDHALAADIIALEGLSRRETSELLAHRGLLDNPASTPGELQGVSQEDMVAAIHSESGGNPLLALAAAPSILRGEKGSDGQHAGERARNHLMSRLNELPLREQEALTVAATLGNQFSWEHWIALWQALNHRPEELVRLAGNLEQHRMLALSGAHYRFASGALRSTVYDAMSRAQRQGMHGKAYGVLVASGEVSENTLLYHAQNGALVAQLFRHALGAANIALASQSAYRALELYNLAEMHRESASELDHCLLRIGRGMTLGLLGERPGQQDDLTLAYKLARELDAPALAAEAGFELSRYYQSIGQLDRSLQSAEDALSLIVGDEFPEWRARLHERVGRVFRDLKEPALAREHLDKALAIYVENDDPLGVAWATDGLGGLAWDTGDYHAAAHFHQQAAGHFGALGDLVRQTQSLNNLGTVYWELGDFESARTTHERGIEVCRAIGDRRGEADNVDNLGGVYWSWGEYDRSIDHYNEALRIRRSIHDQWGTAISLGNIGSALLRKGNLREAIQHYEEAYPFYKEVGRPRGQAYVLHNLGVAWLEAGDVAKANDHLDQALAMREQIGDRMKVIETGAVLALARLARGDDASALESMHRALAELQQDEWNATLQQEVHCAAWQFFEATGDSARALHHLGAAERAFLALTEAIPAHIRESFVTNVPVNRAVKEGVARFATQVDRLCAPRDERQGRSGRTGERVQVRLTVATPGDLQVADLSRRRQGAILRLLGEAERQGVALTDDDLAGLLGVSRRTILRDKASMAQGVS